MAAKQRPNRHLQQEFVVSYDWPSNGAFTADSFTAAVATVKTITLPAKASITDETTIRAYDGFNEVLFGLDVAGDGVAGDDVTIDISPATTAAEVAAIVYTALVASALKGWTFVDNLDGTITATHRVPGTVGNTAWVITTDSDITVVNTTAGAAASHVAGSFTAGTTADAVIKLFKADRACELVKAEVISPTGLTQDASNYFNIKVKNGSNVAANWSTLTGAEGTLTADTFKTMTLGTLANRSFAAGDVLSVQFDETGTADLPPGRLSLHLRYVN